MDIRKLNEDIKALLEGDVVSFADFKNRKTAQRRAQRNAEFEKQFGDELQKSADEWNKTNILLTINKIKVNWAEGPIKNPHYKEGEEFSYENFQEDVWARDYINQIKDAADKCEITIYITTNQGEYNREYKYKFTIGGGRQECDIYQALELMVKAEEGKIPTITNDPVRYNENYYKQLVKEYGIKKPEEEQLPDYVKDYRKDPSEVQVGDILSCTWGYSMTIVDYYRVTERKAKSIKLEKLENKIISGGGYSGKCMPSNKRAEDRYQTDVAGKLFRIGVKWSKDVVCRIKDHSVYFWDGKPDSYDHMD